jgi:hypothetical protein
VIRGNRSPDNRLCDPGETVDIGVLRGNADMTAGLPQTGILPSFTEELLTAVDASYSGSNPSGMTGDAFTSTAQVLAFDEFAFSSGPVNPSVTLALDVDAGDATGLRWRISMDADTELHQVTFAVVGPTGSILGDIAFEGCPTQNPGGSPPANCNTASQVGPHVDVTSMTLPSMSFTAGPHASLPPDTLFVTLTGKTFGVSVNPALNPGAQPVDLGVVVVDSAIGTPGKPPALSLSGAVAAAPISNTPIVRASDLGGVDLPTVALVADGVTQVDTDGDGRLNDTDNCVYEVNPAQLDDGGFELEGGGASIPDFVGNRCQCGEGGGDGVVNAQDVDDLRDILAETMADEDAEERCSISGDDGCDMRDVVVLMRNRESLPAPPLRSVCTKATPLNLPVPLD